MQFHLLINTSNLIFIYKKPKIYILIFNFYLNLYYHTHSKKITMSQQPLKRAFDDQYLDSFMNSSLSLSTSTSETLPESEYLHQYYKYLPTNQQLPSYQQTSRNLLRKGVYECSKQQNPESLLDINQLSIFHIQRQLSINNFEMMVFQVYIGTYQLRVSLLNIKGANPLLKNLYSKCGIYGKIYFAPFLGEEAAIKVYFFEKESELQKHIIVKALKQYSIMKICSILECGPFLNNTFGFDLIAFDDSVMFTMQKCLQMDVIDIQAIKHLKYELRYMHKSRIIHFDIKPDNIMWSKYYQKPIFIDFGFSQIVKANIGQKIMLSFRGSPAYCGEQMIKLLGNIKEQKKNIDAYFNDAQGLKNTIINMKHELSLNKKQNVQAETSLISLDQQIQNMFLVFLLKYKFITAERQGIVELLQYKNSTLFAKYGNEVFQIFQKSISIQLFEYIYSKLEKEFQRFIEPNIIHSYFKYNYKIFSVRHPKNADESTNSEAFNIKMSFTRQELVHNKHKSKHYKLFLSLEKVYSDQKYQEELRHVLIQSLRFDCKNNSVSQKIEWARRFNKANELTQASDRLGPIKTLFRKMFEYCLSKPINKWKRSHIFIVIIQLIMLDINFENYIEIIFQTINNEFQTFHDKVTCLIELCKISNHESFKYKSDFSYMKEKFPSKLLQLGMFVFRSIMKKYQKNCDPQIKIIIRALKQSFRSNKLQQEVKNQNSIKSILTYLPQNTFTNELAEFLFLERLYHFQFKQNMQLKCQILNEMKQYSFYKQFKEKSKIFHHSAYHIIRILIYYKNYKQLIQFLQNIKDSINCPDICEKFSFQMTIFMFNSTINTKQLFKYSNELLNCTNLISFLQINSLFSQLMLKIGIDKQFKDNYPEVFDRFIQSLYFIDKKLIPIKQILSSEEIEKIMYKYNIVTFMLSAYPKFKAENFGKIVNSLASMIQDKQIIQVQKQNYYKFHLFIYQSAYYFAIKRYDKVLVSFEKLYQISKQFRIAKAQDYFIKKIIFAAINANQQQKVNIYAYKLYDFSSKMQSCAPYFQASQKTLITITLYQFQLNGDLYNFYKFLIGLATYVSKYPYESNCRIWFDDIQKLMKIQKYRDLMDYNSLSSHVSTDYWNKRYLIYYFLYSLAIQQNNQIKRQIFIKIVQNIQYLNTYTKEIIMKKVASFIISYYCANKRKMLFILNKWKFKYLDKSYFICYTQKLTKRRYHNCEKIEKIKQKIKQGFEN